MATVKELRASLGDTASMPMIALQLDELEKVEYIRSGIYKRIQAGDVDAETTAEYAKYNQRHNDTMKTLMALLKLQMKTATASKEPVSPYTDEQADLVGVDDADCLKETKKSSKK
jgi:hypothetical protein